MSDPSVDSVGGRCELAECFRCHSYLSGRTWRLAYGRRGISTRDLRETLESGVEPTGFRDLGVEDLFLCQRCQRRLFWRGVVTDLPRQPGWRGRIAAGFTFLLGLIALEHTRIGLLLVPVVLAASIGRFVWIWKRRHEQTVGRLLFEIRRTSLSEKHGVDPERLELVSSPAVQHAA